MFIGHKKFNKFFFSVKEGPTTKRVVYSVPDLIIFIGPRTRLLEKVIAVAQ